MKKILMIIILVILVNKLFSQNVYDDSINWIKEIFGKEKNIRYSIGNTGILVNETRDILISNGWIEFLVTDCETNVIKHKYKYHLSDIDQNSINIRIRNNIDKNIVLYQIWADSIDQQKIIIDYSSNQIENTNYISYYFINRENAEQFAYALRQAIINSPIKIDQIIEIDKGFMYRNVNWGMTIEEVRYLETAELLSDNYGLSYIDEEFGEKIRIDYVFIDGKLKFVINKYLIEIDDFNGYIQKYIELKKIFSEIYGNPFNEEEIWKDDSLKGNTNRYGYAISTEKLMYRATFYTEYTKIIIILSGNKGRPEISVGYVEKK